MEKRTQLTPTTDQKQDNKTQELVNARKDTLSKLKNEEDQLKAKMLKENPDGIAKN